ncbi:MAG: sigma-54-dependent Fis family transcriptional regulator [Deltaproteobacteria bacterium]|nr:sigma-54-dependent Fis family transcriptional regulator [Deltaproteobacteria bacterium]
MNHVLIGRSLSIRKIRELIKMVKSTPFNVLITGETGTGKDVVARLLHRTSPRCNKRFVKVNCAALPGALFESELFGYEKGAFTGADRSKPGKFELASKGVIFLDEIGDTPLAMQMKLLHVLQDGKFTRLGGTKEVEADAWVISSTHHDLEDDIKRGLFREDLYYRLNIIRIDLPPLRERREDIPLLTNYLIRAHRQTLKIDCEISIDDELGKVFQAYHWPGNVRELSNTLLRLMAGDDKSGITDELIANMLADGHQFEAVPFGNLPPTKQKETGKNDGRSNASQSLKEVKKNARRNIERKAILEALNMSGWNKRKAAMALKISYKSLFNKINELVIDKTPPSS